MPQKILLIDDDDDDQVFFCEALEEVAPDIVCNTAGDPRIVIARLDNHDIETPDLIFLDVNMPVMSGWQCLSFLKEQDAYKDIPVIMYSTSSHREEIRKAQKFGALCFFTKPSDFKTLKESLAIVAKHLHNQTLQLLMQSSSLFVVPESKF